MGCSVCSKTGILPVNQLVGETPLLEYWRSFNHSLPSSDLFNFPTNYIMSRSHTSNMLNTPLVKHSTDFIWKATTLWNGAGTDIRLIEQSAKDFIKFHAIVCTICNETVTCITIITIILICSHGNYKLKSFIK